MSVLTDLLFPPKCVSCKTLLDWKAKEKGAFCDACLALWSSDKLDTCGICANAVCECRCLTDAMQKAKCGGFFKSVYYLHGKSTPVQNRLIYYVKRNRSLRVPHFLAEELSEGIREWMREEDIPPQDVIFSFVPRKRSTYLQYGTDQAKALAQALSEELEIPMHALLTRSSPFAKAQKKLGSAQRFRNVRSAYRLRKDADCRKKTVFLVDDVVTTGATVSTCIRLLRRAGAERVFCVAAASDDHNRDTGLLPPDRKA